MLRKIEVVILSVLVCLAFASAGQRQRLRIVPDPSSAGVRAQDDVVRVEWVQLSADAGSRSLVEPSSSCNVYFSTAPAGGNLRGYTKVAALGDNVSSVFGDATSMSTSFIPNRQGGRMGPGAYYVIVATVEGGDTLYSDYFRLMVASADPPAIVSPKANISKGEQFKVVTDLAPVFMWTPVSGVPYYHIVLSDRPFFVSGGKPNAGVNIIWQAITPNTSIAFGAPDPSNTITAAPPPLASGITYSWMVLNNYGNRPAFTTWDVVNVTDGMAGRFLIATDTITSPTVVELSPPRGDGFHDADPIEFRWTNLDTNNAKSYLVNILREGSAESFGMEGMGKFEMGLLAWETTVPRGNRKANDTLSVKFDAKGTLTGGSYKWRVYALDSRGAASTDDARSASTFKYAKADDGRINITTQERIGSVDVPVSYVELKSEVISGPTLAPLLFYTGSNGTQNRPFSAGTYRITAVKEGYFTYTTTVTVSGDKDVVIPMSRPEAVIYGRVVRAGADSSAISAAKVTAVSSWGDTVSAATDDRGGFTFACRAADWTVTVEKPGFAASSPRKVALKLGADTSLVVGLTKSPFALSGVVRNSSGQPVMGARVRILREGVILDELSSTPQNGSYVFYLNAGTYTITAEKPGFAMFSRSGVAVTGTMAQDITLREGAVVVSGAIIGKSWIAGLGYAVAPITSARVTFADVAKPDTFIVISDAVFGKFSVSLPKDQDYKVTASATGFAAQLNARDFNTRNAGLDLSKPYAENGRTDTLYALATIKGRVTGAAAGVPVDVMLYGYDDGRIVASGRVVASGRSDGDLYEVRNIPDGKFRIGAGADGYFTRTAAPAITVEMGEIKPNVEFYNFAMEAGYKSIIFDMAYTGSGTVKVLSPLNRTLSFAPGIETKLEKVGDGGYAVGAIPDDINRLELSYHKFDVSGANNEPHTETLRLPFIHAPNPSGLADTISNDSVKIAWPGLAGGANQHSDINRMVIYYRSEGSARFDSAAVNVSTTPSDSIRFKPVRNGCNLYYYFRVYLKNGDIYGSSNQLYRTFVSPNSKIISRMVVEPGVAREDTLVLPSSYKAEFRLRAFYGDQFVPITGNIGRVTWWRISSGSGSVSGTGMTYSYTTKNGGEDLILQARLEPSAGYKIKSGDPDFVEFPIRVTGQSLDSLSVSRKGVAGPVLNTDTVSFRVEAFDKNRKPVMVSPTWTVMPVGAADAMGSDGLFKPNKKFVGMATVEARVGGRTAKYTDPVEEVPKQRVDYPLRPATRGDTANTLLGMRVVFDTIRAKANDNSYLKVKVPQLTNFVHRGTESYRMADSLAFDVAFSDTGAIGGSVVLEFDIPQNLRDAANSGDYEFRVARWFNDSLRWIPLDSTRMSGGVVSAWLLRKPAGLSKAKKVSAQVSRASSLADSGRYALVIKTNKTALSVSISPHPFSPYIKPVKEYGPDAPAGTCIKVNAQAPDTYVKSVKVRIYNVTGKLVWGIEKLAAQTGENRFWWNGRTNGSEDVWSDDYYNRNAGNPLCRNGRYYVMVIMTDMDGKQMRVAKPLVLMK